MLKGTYFDGKIARGISVQITYTHATIALRGENIDIALPIAQVELSPRLGRTRRQMHFADGAVCELDDDAVLDEWFDTRSQRRWNFIAQLETHWLAVTAGALVIIALAVTAALWGLPWAAQKVAMKIPQRWADQIGSGTLVALDNTLGDDSKLPTARQQQLREQFAALARSADVPAKFEFRTWPRLGANALALPDSTIVMTDALVELSDDDRELLAVIAHELGHEHERHALQQVLASSGVAALVFVMIGDVSGVSNIAIAAPTILTHMHHSRALEHDADRFGFALLQKNQIDPVWFARIIRKLETTHHEKDDENKSEKKSLYSSWVNTHPDSEARAVEAENYLNRQK